jgi:hypothetical protein
MEGVEPTHSFEYQSLSLFCERSVSMSRVLWLCLFRPHSFSTCGPFPCPKPAIVEMSWCWNTQPDHERKRFRKRHRLSLGPGRSAKSAHHPQGAAQAVRQRDTQTHRTAQRGCRSGGGLSNAVASNQPSHPDGLHDPQQAGYYSHGPISADLRLGFSFSGLKEPGKGRPRRIRLRSSSTSHARATCARALAVVSGLKASASKTRCIATACEKAVEQFGRDLGPALSGSSGAACM